MELVSEVCLWWCMRPWKMTLFWQLLTVSGACLAVEKCLRNCGKCRGETKVRVWSVFERSGSAGVWKDGWKNALVFSRWRLLLRSLMFVVHVLSGTRLYWVFSKGGNKVEANRLKNKTQKNLLGLWIRAFGQSLAVLFVLLWLWLFFGGTGERGVVFFGLKSCEKGMLLRKKTILHELCYWNSTNNKLQFYSSFKMTRDASVQIDLIKNLQQSGQSLAKWRSVNHDLRIETGRHCVPKIPENVRICQHCSSNNIENKLHIIFDCRSLH